MNALINFFKAVGKHLAKNGQQYGQIAIGMVFATTIALAASNKAHKKLEAKHRKEDAERMQAEFDKKLHEIEKRYKHNEYVMKQRINDLCKEFGIDPVC